MRRSLVLHARFVSCAPLVLAALLSSVGCSKSDSGSKAVEYGDAVGIEFGDATSGHFLAAVAAQKGHSPEKGVSAIATALQAAAKGCPDLVKEASDTDHPPTLHFVVTGGALVAAAPASNDPASVACMTKAMNGKPSSLEAATPFELTIQLLTKKAAP